MFFLCVHKANCSHWTSKSRKILSLVDAHKVDNLAQSKYFPEHNRKWS